MTPTQPSQAVEHLKSLIDQYWSLAYREGTEGRTHDTEDGAAQATLHEINKVIAELARPQEVAVVGYRDEDGIVWPVPAMTTPSPNLAEYFSAPQVRAMIAASRAPVEVVRAEPSIQELAAGAFYPQVTGYTAPPSTTPAKESK